jgi:hypothetical protein
MEHMKNMSNEFSTGFMSVIKIVETINEQLRSRIFTTMPKALNETKSTLMTCKPDKNT